MTNQPEKLTDSQNKNVGEKSQQTEEKAVVEAVPTVEEGRFCCPTIQ